MELEKEIEHLKMDSMIQDKLLQIWKDRRDAISKFMDEYDAKVYNPQLEAIEKEARLKALEEMVKHDQEMGLY